MFLHSRISRQAMVFTHSIIPVAQLVEALRHKPEGVLMV
jgi:hypothetical protein